MANLSVTVAEVVLNSGPFADGISGAAITSGQGVYLSASGTWLPAKSNGTQVEAGQYGLGIAVNSQPATGGPVRVALPGADVTIGATAAPALGKHFVVSATAGSIADTADITTSTQWKSALAICRATSKLRVVGVPAEVALP